MAGASFFLQIKALLWKDVRLAKNNKKATIAEIYFPIMFGALAGFFMFLITLITGGSGNNQYDKLDAFHPFGLNTTWVGMAPASSPEVERVHAALPSFVAQQNASVKKKESSPLWENTTTAVPIPSGLPTFSTQLFPDSASVLNGVLHYLMTWYAFNLDHIQNASKPMLMAVDSRNATSWRFNATNIPASHQIDSFASLGLFVLQTLLPPPATEAMRPPPPGAQPYTVRINNGTGPITTLGDQSFSFNLQAVFSSTAMLFLIYAFIPSTIVSGGRLVEEKRVRMRETLKVMGLRNSVYVSASIIAGLMRMVFGMALISVILFGFKAIAGSDVLLVLGIGVAFTLSLVSFAQILPAFCSQALWANVFCLVFLSGGAAISSLSTGWGSMGATACCLLSPVAFYYALLPALAKNSVFLVVDPTTAIVMLLIDSALYLLIAQYTYAIWPGDFGVAKHPLFPLMWLTSGCGMFKKPHDVRLLGGGRRNADAELTPSQTPRGDDLSKRVIVRQLVKQFGITGIDAPAVDKLDLTIYGGEIFALLGHNGAGKTTTISMLTGMIKASGYLEASVNGLDIGTEMDEIRRTSLGFCPQFDVLYDDLSAYDHFTLFSMIKGQSGSSVSAEVNEMLLELELPTTDQPSSTYSGGMKRRLSTGNALIGKPSVVFLDEPSSGMDPLSRRKMWDLLKRQKDGGRTVVLTTHFMEEADYLGDRIAIMSHGRMFACSSSYELKRDHGVGFTLNCAKQREDPVIAERVLECLRKHVPEVQMIHEGSMDAVYRIPADKLPVFGAMLEDLERRRDDLGIHSYGVSMCSLEDVFVSVSAKIEKEMQEHRSPVHANTPAPRVAGSPTARYGAAAASGGGHHDDGNALRVPDRTRSGANVEDLFEAASKDGPNESNFAVFMHQFGTVFDRKVTLLRRVRRMQFMGIGFPIFFMFFGFLAIQPSTNKIGGNFAGFTDVDRTDVNLLMVNLGNASEGMIVWDEVKRLYRQSHPADPEPTYFEVNDFATWASGSYLPLHSLSFVEGFKAPQVTAGFMVHTSDLGLDNATAAAADPLPPLSASCNYTLLTNSNINPAFAAEFAMLLTAAVNNVVARARAALPAYAASPPFSFTDLRVDSNRLALNLSTMPGNGNDNGSSGSASVFNIPQTTTTYNMQQTGIYLCISMAQLIVNCALPVADEFKRSIYGTTTALGLKASAYFAANLFFDVLFAFVPMTCFVIGVFAKDLVAYHSGALVVIFFAGLQYALCLALFAYTLVLYFRNFTPIAYTAIVHSVNLGFLGMPYLIKLILNAIAPTKSLEAKIDPFLLSMTPQVAFYHLIDDASEFTAETTSFSALFTFSGIQTGWDIVFLFTHMILPGFLVYSCAAQGRLFVKFTSWSQQRAAKRDAALAAYNATHALKKRETAAAAGVKRIALTNSSTLAGQSMPLVENASPDPINNSSASCPATAIVPAASPGCHVEDPDVVTERRYVHEHPDDQMIALLDLHKRYGNIHALRGITLGVRPRECFGLLGPNGAGKSTTCKLMMRDVEPSSGDVRFPYCHVDGATPITEVFKRARLGVCHQHDTLFEYMTAEEHLEYYLKLRLSTLYKEYDWSAYIHETIAAVQLGEAQGKTAGQYSGGMKRKLQVALAMYTGARVAFLDEPSTGMDPFARRALWRVILDALCKDRSVILTTHSMDEAEAVCGRISIVTHGTMRCLGSGQHLKDRYGSGYLFTLGFLPSSSSSERVDACNEFIAQYPDARLVENLDRVVKFSVKHVPSLAGCFTMLEARKRSWNLEEYSVSQTANLEQVFLSFVTTTIEDDDNPLSP